MALVRRLRDHGVTIILTTHYIDEAEEMADRIGVINDGELILVEDEKTALMKKLGKKQLTLTLQEPLAAIPPELAEWQLALHAERPRAAATPSTRAPSRRGVVPRCCGASSELGIGFKDLNTQQELARGHLRQPRARRA